MEKTIFSFRILAFFGERCDSKNTAKQVWQKTDNKKAA